MSSSDKFHIDAVDSSANLRTLLAGTDISMARRTKGRTTEDTERWTICRLLATLNQQGRLHFPLKLTHGDRPDFELVLGNSSTGIEITEAISRDYAACLALAEHIKPDAVIDLSLFRPNSPRKTIQELRKIIAASTLMGPGWAGNAAEKDWATSIADVVSSKKAKLGKAGYRKFPRNWLAIYDNLPLPNVNLVDAVALLVPKIEPLWGQEPWFDAVFIEHGPVIVEITRLTITHHTLADLWQVLTWRFRGSAEQDYLNFLMMYRRVSDFCRSARCWPLWNSPSVSAQGFNRVEPVLALPVYHHLPLTWSTW